MKKMLRPVSDPREIYQLIEREIIRVLRRELYLPIIAEFSEKKILNAKEDALFKALRTGRITYHRGVFSGQFTAQISQRLRELGAKWNRRDSNFRILRQDLPPELQNAIAASTHQFERKMSKIRQRLDRLSPSEIAGRVQTEPYFARAIAKTESGLNRTLAGITIPMELTPEQQAVLAREWQNNMDRWIEDFSAKQIRELREKLQKSVFAGNRHEHAVKTIQRSFGVTKAKAKFLASQETRLLVTQLKQMRYLDAGVSQYKWKSVAGTPAHPVRPRHRELNDESARGHLFRFDQPPVTSGAGESTRRNNPGQDYNCRCVAIPIVDFRNG
jgi:SPP1 gp7 family putative phage head morphogenesis protein